MKLPTAEALLEIAREYYPPDKQHLFMSENHPASDRRFELMQQLFDSDLPRWRRRVGKEVQHELPDFGIWDPTGPDPSFMIEAYEKLTKRGHEFRFLVVGAMSLLAPVYTVYAVRQEWCQGKFQTAEVSYEVPHRLRRPAEVIARKIEAEFKVTRLPNEVAQTRIPLYVESHKPGEATLFHALFSAEPGNLS